MHVEPLSLSVAEALIRAQSPKGEASRAEPPRGHRLCIAVSREVGALGESVARELGRRLGWPVFDREIVEKIAQELHQPTAALRAVDERPTLWVEDWFSAFGRQRVISADTYVKYLVATMHGLAATGHCIIVGRGAARILPPDHALRVRVVANRADRLRVICQRRHCNEPAAAEWMAQTEHERNEFMRRYFGADATDVHHYDLIVNTSRYSVPEAADLIAHAAQRLEVRNTTGH